MKEIKHLIDFIDEEMDGVKDYIKYASKVKGIDDITYSTIMEIIPQEVRHIELLHDTAVKEIEKAQSELKAKGKDIPEYMLDMWQEEHEDYIECMANLKYKIEMLKR